MRRVVLRNSTADAESDDVLLLVILTQRMMMMMMMMTIMTQLDEKRMTVAATRLSDYYTVQ